MSQWTHPQCEACWIGANSVEVDNETLIRMPVVVQARELNRCCFCGAPTVAGIYVRADPTTLAFHEDHDE